MVIREERIGGTLVGTPRGQLGNAQAGGFAERGGGIALCNVPAPVREVLGVSGIATVLAIHATREAGMTALLRATLENMSQGVAMYDADSRLVTWNAQLRAYMDMPDEFLGTDRSDCDTKPVDLARLVDKINALLRAGD